MGKPRFGDDSKVVESCIKGDLAAWSCLLNKYSGLISSSIEIRLKKYGFIPLREEVEDIKQIVLTSLWNGGKLEKIANRRNISYWLSMVCGNTAIEYMRKKERSEPAQAVNIDTIDEDSLSEISAIGGMGKINETQRAELTERIDAAISSLPATEKLIVKLSLLYGKKYDEISDMLSLPRGTVSSYLKRAKEKLKKKLRDFEEF